MASRGLVAFLGGAAAKGSSILDEQRKAKMEEERQRLLLTLREESETRMAEKAEARARTRTDSNFSGVDGDEYVYRDTDGNETRRRPLTEDEKAARAAAADEKAWDRDYKERQLALQRRGQDISAANARARSSRGDGDDEDTTSKSLEDVMVESLMDRYQAEIKDYAEKKGIPRAEFRAMALETVMSAESRAAVTGAYNSREMSDDFFKRMRESYDNLEEPGWRSGTTRRSDTTTPSSYTHVSSRGTTTVPYPASKTRD